MSRSSEDVLLQMGEVRFKKGDGTLYVMSERLAWIADNSDTVAVSHRFAEIKSQKISPEGKPKVQLQVVLHDGNTSTFHFVNRGGLSAMLDDREKVKELLQRLLPNFKSKVNKELEQKKQMLLDYPNLLQLYKDLVVTKVITSEEFWSLYGKQYARKTKKTDKQNIGVSAGFLSDIKPQVDGCNGLKYNLTTDTILSIFKTYPAVKKKHSENVPHKMTEAEFWTKFFQSHYFHRDRMLGGTKDIFAECGRMDDNTLKEAVQHGPEDKLLDLNSFEDVQLEEGFLENTLEKDKSSNVVHQSMIKRFNQHSTMVLHTSSELNKTSSKIFMKKRKHDKSDNKLEMKIISNYTGKKKFKNDMNNFDLSDNSDNNTTSDSITDANTTNSTTDMENIVENAEDTENKDNIEQNKTNDFKKKKLLNKIIYDDLGNPGLCNAKEKETDFKGLELLAISEKIKMVGINGYLRAPANASNAENSESFRPMEEMSYSLISLTEKWKNCDNDRHHLSSTSAVNALGDLSPGGALMRGYHDQGCAHHVPKEFERELRDLYVTVSELLKPFYKIFPLLTKERRHTAKRLSEALAEFKKVKVEPFEERILQKLSPVGATLTQHLNSLIEAAQRKYTKWHGKKKRDKVLRAIVQSRLN